MFACRFASKIGSARPLMRSRRCTWIRNLHSRQFLYLHTSTLTQRISSSITVATEVAPVRTDFYIGPRKNKLLHHYKNEHAFQRASQKPHKSESAGYLARQQPALPNSLCSAHYLRRFPSPSEKHRRLGWWLEPLATVSWRDPLVVHRNLPEGVHSSPCRRSLRVGFGRLDALTSQISDT